MYKFVKKLPIYKMYLYMICDEQFFVDFTSFKNF